jgi:argininosuccinate synthase
MPATPGRWPSSWKSGRSLPNRTVVAYSGTLNSSIAVAWLKERHDGEVIAVTLDVGQGRELSQIRERAMAAGANRCHVLDVREEFIREFVLRTLQADALQGPPLPIALSRPLIAQKLLQMAQMEGASAVAHGCAGGADNIRLETALKGLQPDVKVITPLPASGMTRAESIEYARERRLPGLGAYTEGYELRQNLWGRTLAHRGSDSETAAALGAFYVRTKSPALAPEAGAFVDIDWNKGVPVAINGVGMLLTELVDSLDLIAGGHGVGRFKSTETDAEGVASPVVGEAPAATVLHAAHRDLERLVTPDDLQRLKRSLSKAYVGLIEDGSWFSPARTAIDAFALSIQHRVTGTVRVKLSRGVCQVVERRPLSASAGQQADGASPSGSPVWAGASDEGTPSHTATE